MFKFYSWKLYLSVFLSLFLSNLSGSYLSPSLLKVICVTLKLWIKFHLLSVRWHCFEHRGDICVSMWKLLGLWEGITKTAVKTFPFHIKTTLFLLGLCENQLFSTGTLWKSVIFYWNFVKISYFLLELCKNQLFSTGTLWKSVIFYWNFVKISYFLLELCENQLFSTGTLWKSVIFYWNFVKISYFLLELCENQLFSTGTLWKSVIFLH